MSVNNNLTVGPRKQQSRAKVNNGGCGEKSYCAHTLKLIKNGVDVNNFLIE